MATIVIGHDFVQLGPYVVDPRHFKQETGKLPNSGRQRTRRGEGLRLLLENVLEMMGDHRGARSRGHNNMFGAGEHGKKMPGHLARFVAESAVEGRLAATGLGFGKIYFVAGALEHFGHRHAHFREQLIDDAGDKQRDPSGHESQIVACATISISERRSYGSLNVSMFGPAATAMYCLPLKV